MKKIKYYKDLMLVPFKVFLNLCCAIIYCLKNNTKQKRLSINTNIKITEIT